MSVPVGLAWLQLCVSAAWADEPFELADGDRVVFVGSTFVERDQAYGYFETMLTARWPDRHVSFRNLGWSGDTVWGDARAGFDTAAEGYKRLIEQVAAVRPTVVLMSYGWNESFEGAAGLDRFRAGLKRLCDELDKFEARMVMISPLAQEPIEPGRRVDGSRFGALPDPGPRNEQLSAYVAVLRELSADRGYAFIDLFTPSREAAERGERPFHTENGVHLGRTGYWRVARALAGAMELRPAAEMKEIGRCDSVILQCSAGAQVRDFEKTDSGFRFYAELDALPLLPAVAGEQDVNPEPRRFKFSGLPAGTYRLRVDGKAAEVWEFEAVQGSEVWVPVPDAPEVDRWESLRRAIVEKNRLYFHRWRPQNETYLFGFRKHEQGQNAAEVAEFERLVAAQEQQVAELRVPVTRKYEIVRLERKSVGQIPSRIPDPDPEIERQSFRVADGFEVNLFAADPMLAKPIQMNWDASGRLWIASSEVYPQIEPGQVANDKILVLEDVDGDGRADKTTVFADGLLIPTGVEPGDGGAYVANSTELLHLSDSDGDGRADRSRVVLSGFGTEDTHHIIHTFRWGHDGCLYFNQSIYIHSHVETPWGVRRLGGGGIWQFRPQSSRLEVFARGFVNTWGHHFDDWGQSFATDGAYGEGINYVFPGATFFSAPGASRILKGLNPGSPKHCGLEIVGGRHLPDDWQGNMLTNDFRGHRVCRFVISEDGSGYASREQPELIRSDHVAFRPIDIKLGPDGAIYIADWYNPIIQHGEVDFRDPRRDHTRGRIWRVSARDRPLVPRPRLESATVDELLDALESPERWTRHFARRVLAERGADAVLPALDRRAGQWDWSRADSERHALELLWTYQALDVAEPVLLRNLLMARDHRVRAGATRVLAHWHDRVRDPVGAFSSLVADDHPRVRLEAVRALPRLESAQAAEVALRALDRPVDSFLDYALGASARELADQWLPIAERATRSSELGLGGTARHQTFALLAVGTERSVAPLLVLLREGKVPKENEPSVLALVGRHGRAEDLAMVFDLVVAGDDARWADRGVELLTALESSTRQRKVQPAGDLSRLEALLDAAPADHRIRELILQLAGRWGVSAMQPRLRAVAGSAESSDRLRRAAMDGLALFRTPESQADLEVFCSSDYSLPVRKHAVAALATVSVAAAAGRAATLLAEIRSDSDSTDVFSSFLERKDGPKALAAALADQRLPADVAKIGVRLAQVAGRTEPELVAALNRAGELAEPAPAASPETIEAIVHEVLERGDAARGEIVFRRKELSCLKCHSIAGAGGLAGPDLLSLGASAPVDYIVESLLDPNKKVKEGFHSVVVATRDGRVVTGLKVRQSDSELILRDAEDREVPIATSSIEEQKTGGSIMPTGITDSVTHGELVDLVRFLSELGKSPAYSAQGRVARRWQTLEATPELAREISHAGIETVLRASPRLRWEPAYATVSGNLPVGELRPIKIGYQSRTLGVVRCEIDCSTAGSVGLSLNSVEGLRLWLNESAVPAGLNVRFDLSPGRHTLTLAVDLDTRREPVRCELQDVPGSKAQVQFVTGK